MCFLGTENRSGNTIPLQTHHSSDLSHCLERKEGASGGQGGRGTVLEQLCLCWAKVTLPTDAFLSDWE